MNPARLKTARKHHGLTQSELAEQVGVTQSLIGQYERGEKRPGLDTLQKLTAVLQVTLPWLLGDQVAETLEEYNRAQEKRPPRAAILTDYNAPIGLRELASNPGLYASLNITDAEWRALRSLVPPGDLSMDGYVAVLFALRAGTRT